MFQKAGDLVTFHECKQLRKYGCWYWDWLSTQRFVCKKRAG